MSRFFHHCFVKNDNSFVLFSADDHQALIWDIQSMPRAIDDPILAYTAGGEINQVRTTKKEHLV